MVRIGFSLWREDLRRIGTVIKDLIDSGMDHAEISVDSPLDIEIDDLRSVANAVRDAGASLGIHLPWRELFLASPVEELRSTSTAVIARVINQLLRHEPSYFVVHGSSDQWVCSKHEDLCLDSLKRSLEELSGITDRIALETIQGSCCGRGAQVARILKDLPWLRACVDLAHIAAENIVRGKGRWPSMISEAVLEVPEDIWRRTLIIHLHGLRDRDRKPRSHYDFSQTPLGAEDIARVAKIWGIGYVVFEVFYRSSGGSAEPRDLSEEARRIRSWLSLLG